MPPSRPPQPPQYPPAQPHALSEQSTALNTPRYSYDDPKLNGKYNGDVGEARQVHPVPVSAPVPATHLPSTSRSGPSTHAHARARAHEAPQYLDPIAQDALELKRAISPPPAADRADLEASGNFGTTLSRSRSKQMQSLAQMQVQGLAFKGSEGTQPTEAADADEDKVLDKYVVKFEGDNDPLDPRAAPFWKRAATFVVIAINAFLVSAFASAYLFLVPELEVLFGCSRELAVTAFVVYVIGWGPGPLIWAPLSDSIGRKPVYIGSAFLWTVFNIGCARAQNITTLIVCRFFSGFFGCAAMTNGGGSAVDVWTGLSVVRGSALYSAIVFLGPVIGPIIGGAVEKYSPSTSLADDEGWRWLFYAAIIAGCGITLLHCLVMETHHNIRLRRRVRTLRKAHPDQPWTTEADSSGLSLGAKMYIVSLSAIKMIGEEPIIFFVSIWQTTVMAIIYLFFESFAVIFGAGHGMDAFEVGLTFLGIGVGMLLACGWSLTGELTLWVRRVKRAKGERQPEMRIPQGLMGAVLTVVGLFWFGYTSYPSVHWIVPILGSAVYGAGALSVMLATFSYIVDTFQFRAAPAFAALGLIRSVVTGVLPLCGTQFYQNVGPRQATLILACIALLEIGIPVAAMKFGPVLRGKSKFAMNK